MAEVGQAGQGAPAAAGGALLDLDRPTPFTLSHPRIVARVGYALIGPVQRLFEHVDSTPGQYTERAISPYFWHNGQYPDSPKCTALFDGERRLGPRRDRVDVVGAVQARHPDVAHTRALQHAQQQRAAPGAAGVVHHPSSDSTHSWVSVVQVGKLAGQPVGDHQAVLGC